MDLRPKKRLKILIHQPRLSYYIGGGETVPLEQASLLSRLGHGIEILTSQGPKKSMLFRTFCKENPRIKIHYLQLTKMGQKIYKEQPGERWFRWDVESILFGQTSLNFYFLNKNRWNLVITHLLSDSLFIPRSLTNILHLHGVPEEKRELDKVFLKRPDGFIAVAKFVKKGWEKLYPQLKKEKVKVCYNGINAQKFPNLNINRDIDLLFVGRLLKIKGIYTILDALKILTRENFGFNKLIIVGQGPEKLKIKQKIKNLHLSEKVGLLGPVSHKRLINLYNRAKIFLCPSYSKEGVLTTMLEAASCGCTIISANCCGMIEFIKNGTSGMLAKPADAPDLSRKIKLLLTSSQLQKKLARNTEKQIRKNWDISKTGKILENTYLNFIK